MKIVIASCAKVQDIDDQDVWQEIAAEEPDALLLLGDNIYLAHDGHKDAAALAADLADRYRDQFAERHFAALVAKLRDRQKPLLACYDDHDFLGNDRYGGDDAPALRDVARELFIKTWSPPQTGADVYAKIAFPDVDLLVLDTRYYREWPMSGMSLTRDAILGAAQWKWLEDAIAASRSKYLMLASGSTFHNFGHTECWENYPAAFGRLRDLIGHHAGAFIVSGDIHNNRTYDDSGVVEIVSSGVARRGMVFGGLRRNYGILTFGDRDLTVELRSNKPDSRQTALLSLDDWRLK